MVTEDLAVNKNPSINLTQQDLGTVATNKKNTNLIKFATFKLS